MLDFTLLINKSYIVFYDFQIHVQKFTRNTKFGFLFHKLHLVKLRISGVSLESAPDIFIDCFSSKSQTRDCTVVRQAPALCINDHETIVIMPLNDGFHTNKGEIKTNQFENIVV